MTDVGMTREPKVFSAKEVTLLRSKVAALAPSSKVGLDRDTALDLLSQLEDLQARRRRGPYYVFCPDCDRGFDIGHDHRPRPRRTRPYPTPRLPDPIGDADSTAGAERATRSLAQAMHLGRVPDSEAYLTELGRAVLGPLLYVARATGLSMGDVARLSHPEHLGDTLAFVTAILDSLPPAAGADDLQRDWAVIAEEESRLRRMAFVYAYGMVRHWQQSTGWPWPAEALGERGQSDGPTPALLR